LPLSRKYSAMRVQYIAARRRINGASSAGDATFAEAVLDEFFHLAAPFTDQADHDDVGLGEAGHHAQQHTLAHAGTGKQAQTLTAADRQQTVDAANAHVQRLADGVAFERVDCGAVQRHPVLGFHAALAVKRPTGTVEDAAEHGHAHGQASGVRQRHHTGARRDAGDTAHRHQEHLAARETHDLGFDLNRLVTAVVDDHAAAAHRGAQAFRFKRQTDHAQQSSFDDRLRGQGDGLGVRAQAFGEAGAFKAHR
jgi:hypothetical protein